jgi:hypothetical protein
LLNALGGSCDMVRVKSSQKWFTEAEVASLTGICREHLRSLVEKNRIGTMASASIAGTRAKSWLFTNSDVMTLSDLQSRCEH